MSDTPRTDAIFEKQPTASFWWPDFARQLERELNAATKAHKDASEFAVCAYCQTRFLKNPLHVLEHMEVCEKHPMRILNAKIDEFRLRYDFLRSLIPIDFKDLWIKNLETGIPFDDLVDAAIKEAK